MSNVIENLRFSVIFNFFFQNLWELWSKSMESTFARIYSQTNNVRCSTMLLERTHSQKSIRSFGNSQKTNQTKITAVEVVAWQKRPIMNPFLTCQIHLFTQLSTQNNHQEDWHQISQENGYTKMNRTASGCRESEVRSKCSLIEDLSWMTSHISSSLTLFLMIMIGHKCHMLSTLAHFFSYAHMTKSSLRILVTDALFKWK